MIKKLLIFLVIMSISIPFVDAIPLSDKTGLKYTFPIQTDDHSFVIEVTGNMDVTTLDFDKDTKSITLFVQSSLETNSLEISFPNDLLGGDYTIFLDNTEFSSELQKGNSATFVTMDFLGIGKHKIEIFGTTYLDFFEIRDVIDFEISDGYVDDIQGDQSSNSLIFTLFDPGDTGQLSIKISDYVIAPFDDGTFIVLVDDIESDYVINDSTLYISFDSNNEQIKIIGTYVIPEFQEIAPLVLATTFIAVTYTHLTLQTKA